MADGTCPVVLQVSMKSQACRTASFLTLLLLLAYAHQANAAKKIPGTFGPHRCHRCQYVAGNLGWPTLQPAVPMSLCLLKICTKREEAVCELLAGS